MRGNAFHGLAVAILFDVVILAVVAVVVLVVCHVA